MSTLEERLTEAEEGLRQADSQDLRAYYETVIDSLAWNLGRFHLTYKGA